MINRGDEVYLQFRDYLTQVMRFSEREGIPKITQRLIAEKLSVDTSGVSYFLSLHTKKPKKMLTNLIKKYPLEYAKWPKTADKINRHLKKDDVVYFLTLSYPESVPQPTHIPKPLPKPIRRETVQPELVISTLPLIPATAATIPPVRKLLKIEKLAKAPIAISYRGHDSDKDAKGMFFDHIRMQTIIKTETKSLVPTGVLLRVQKLFTHELKKFTVQLAFGQQNDDLRKCPDYVHDCADLGLLIIPGRARNSENETIRLNHECTTIRSALNRGQPLVGICAGSWRVWEQLFMWTRGPGRHQVNHLLVDVQDHSYGGGMIRLNASGAVCYNVDMHDVAIQNDSLLKTVSGGTATLTVNSVHWKAVSPDASCRPLNVKISALSKRNPDITLKSRQQESMRPQEGCVEAFETIFGAPIICFQWHPEAYASTTEHGRLLKYMALAGSAYAAKRKMLQQFVREVPVKN